MVVSDHASLRAAAALAQSAIGLSDPNPRVGCILHSADGRLIGQDHTQQAGGPHAEVMALRAAQAAGHDTRGGTAWVTLEPCAHHGRTPPCCDALIAAELARVVVACTDPFPQVAGQGIARLRAAGIQVDLLEDASLRREIQDLNIGFFSRVQRQRPWVRAKVAASLDGRTALPNGQSQWITGSAARADGHLWRRRAGAVLTGAGTVRDDDPRMDVREVATQVQPLRVVLDSRHRLSLQSRILQPPGQCLIVAAMPPSPERAESLKALSVETLLLPGRSGSPGDAPQPAVDLALLMQALAARGINELHLEAGATLTGAMWQAGLIDEWLLYQAPVLLGPGRPMAALPELGALADARRLRWIGPPQAVGEDLRLRLLVEGADAFLGSGLARPAQPIDR